jgi:alpha-tubulin suppressor-like RCC1 family protein
LGIGNNNDQDFPQPILFFKNPEEIIFISCGCEFCICVCKNGVFSWGRNGNGQLGIGNQINQFSPQQIESFKNPKEISSISCGNDFCVCVYENAIYSWGQNRWGQLGIGNEIDQCNSPQSILFFKNSKEIISLSCGAFHCICICKNGVFSWGNNSSGELGIGNFNNQFSPQPILFFKNSEDIIAICCGSGFCIGICKNGVFGWGANRYGQLGIGNNIDQNSPQHISFFKNPEEIISLCCGRCFCICICKNGVFSWGLFKYLEDNTNILLGWFYDKYNYSPQQIMFETHIKSYSNLSFPKYSLYWTNKEKIIFLLLAREYLDPEQSLFGKDYLPLDIFKTLLKMI